MKKKLLFFIESLAVGGAEKSLVTLLNSADFSKYSVDLFMLKKGEFFSDLPPDINVVILKELKPSLLKRVQFHLLKTINFKKRHAAQNFWAVYGNEFKRVTGHYDVAIAYSQGFSTYFVAEKVSASRKYSWINTDYQKSGYQISSDYPFYKAFDKIIAVSSAAFTSFNDALESIKVKLPIEIIKDIADKDLITRQAAKPLNKAFSPDKINLVSVGRLVAVKGFHLAVSACAILKSKGYHFNWYIVGEGVERKQLEQQINKESLQEYFFLLGADANPYPYMKACDIYVQTSLFEGLGLTVIEASYLNKPIVCTNFTTVHVILNDEETGLIAEMSAESIAAKIERLILDEKLQDYLSQNLAMLQNRDMAESLEKFADLINIEN